MIANYLGGLPELSRQVTVRDDIENGDCLPDGRPANPWALRTAAPERARHRPRGASAAAIAEVGRSPLDVLRRTAAEALLLCEAHSAGVSTLEGGFQAQHQTLRCWTVGPPHWQCGPTYFSPEGLTIDRNATQLFLAKQG